MDRSTFAQPPCNPRCHGTHGSAACMQPLSLEELLKKRKEEAQAEAKVSNHPPLTMGFPTCLGDLGSKECQP